MAVDIIKLSYFQNGLRGNNIDLDQILCFAIFNYTAQRIDINKRSGYVAVYGSLATGLNSRVRLYSA